MKESKNQKYKEIKDRLQDKHTDRDKTSLFLSKSLFKRFKIACGNASPSKVIEELMEDFIEHTK